MIFLKFRIYFCVLLWIALPNHFQKMLQVGDERVLDLLQVYILYVVLMFQKFTNVIPCGLVSRIS
jgi:hypothetical protein